MDDVPDCVGKNSTGRILTVDATVNLVEFA